MDKSERLNLVLATRDSLLRDLDDEDRWLTLEEFGVEDHEPTDSFGSGPSIGQLLRAADNKNLLQLARHLGVDLPPSAQSAAQPTALPAIPESLFVFASHLSSQKRLTWDVSQEIKLFGI